MLGERQLSENINLATKRSLRLRARSVNEKTPNSKIKDSKNKNMKLNFKSVPNVKGKKSQISRSLDRRRTLFGENQIELVEIDDDDNGVRPLSPEANRIRDNKQEKKSSSSVIKNGNHMFDKKPNNIKNSPEILKISTNSFYSNTTNDENKTSKIIPLKISPTVLKMVASPPLKRKSPKIKKKINTLFLGNKGVTHKITKKIFKTGSRKSIDDFLKTAKCEKFKYLPSNRISLDKVREVHSILNANLNPISLARPLRINCNPEAETSNFSDIDSSDVDDSDFVQFITSSKPETKDVKSSNCSSNKENSIDLNSNKSPSKPKKFFKSGQSSAKQVKITDNIKLGLNCGKLSLLSEKKKRTKHIDKSFTHEQAAVNDIIKHLESSPKKIDNPNESFSPKTNEINKPICNTFPDSLEKEENDKLKKFRVRIPYNTNDPNEIERQNLLLDFLINNNICSEKNFEIFISDPDNHKKEADEIINNLVEIVNDNSLQTDAMIDLDPFEHFRNQIPYNTNDPEKAKEQEILLDFLIENNICNEENFTLFIKELESRKDEAERIIENVSNLESNKTSNNGADDSNNNQNNSLEKPSEENKKLYPIFYSGKKFIPIVKKFTRDNKIKILQGSYGLNQYQIDAGQKEFGAKQCSKCGLVYTVHEPEEEKIHKEYHDSLLFLKFRGWIDEDIVGNFFEWSNDGRIIRITSSEHLKKKERLLEVLKVVDKELGFASYVLPAAYVAFLAVRKHQFVGLCLVHFIDKANRYVKIDGVDCSTEEYFDARLGVSRIWVSPLCRRMGIASKLLNAARSNSIFGESVDTDKIAFSPPTQDGIVFAQKFSNRSDFLIYH